MNLSELKIGESAKITKIILPASQFKRLRELGLSEGVKVKLIRKALNKTPIQIEYRNISLALRESVAQNIMVERL